MVFKVLIADDDYINRQLLISLLKKELYHVEILEAVDGHSALALCREHLDIQLILLDIEMPIMDGADFLRAYQEDDTLPKVPLLVISSNDLRSRELLDLGANAFLMKPIGKEKLLEAISSAHH